MNRSLEFRTPIDIVTGHKPQLKLLHSFGCVAYARIPLDLQKKFEKKAIETIFLGYDRFRKAYRLFNPETKKVIFKAPGDVMFDDFKYRNSESLGVPMVFPWVYMEEIDRDGPRQPSLEGGWGPQPATPPIILREDPIIPKELDTDSRGWLSDVHRDATSGLRSGKKFGCNTIDELCRRY